MSLVNMKQLLDDAKKNKYAVGAFNMLSVETVRGAIKAAEELNSPIILMLAEVHMPMAPIEYLAPIMVQAAKNASVPVAVHFDHGVTFDKIALAIELGFSSVMIDGASKSLEENIRITNEVIKIAHPKGITVEAELGRVGLGEEGNCNVIDCLTKVDDAITFARGTGVDALAVAIGNLHGQYKEPPCLHFERLKELGEALEVPIVLHGGSGISPEDFKKCVKMGMQKVNVGTAIQLSATKEVTKVINATGKTATYFDIMEAIIEGSYNAVKEHILIFGSKGKASI